MSSHTLYKAFKASTPAFGTWITLPGGLTARYIAGSSPHLSWVMIDCEHGATSLSPGASEAIHAIAGLGADAPSALVRIPATGACSSTSWQIKYALDAGARGVLVPMVCRCDLLVSFVDDSIHVLLHEGLERGEGKGDRLGLPAPSCWKTWLWKPIYADGLGRQSIGVFRLRQRTHPGHCSDRDQGWRRECRRDRCCRRTRSVALTSFISLLQSSSDCYYRTDALFIGPYDLSLSLGYPPPSPDPHPEVETVIQHILEVAHSKGKKWYLILSLHYRYRVSDVTSAVRSIAHPERRRPSVPNKGLTWQVLATSDRPIDLTRDVD